MKLSERIERMNKKEVIEYAAKTLVPRIQRLVERDIAEGMFPDLKHPVQALRRQAKLYDFDYKNLPEFDSLCEEYYNVWLNKDCPTEPARSTSHKSDSVK